MGNADLIARVAGQDREGGDAPSRLGRTEWLSAALRLFIEEGIGALRITRLAEELSVTRGSFYWHFKDRGELLAAITAFWKRKNTAAVVTAVEEARSLSDGVLRLFDAWVDPDSFDPRLDIAMREWARRSDAIRAAVEAADARRIDAITAFYRRFGYPMPDAFIRARVIYFTQLGYYALEVQEPMTERLGYLEAYYESFTGRRLGAKAAAAYRARHLAGEHAEGKA